MKREVKELSEATDTFIDAVRDSHVLDGWPIDADELASLRAALAAYDAACAAINAKLN